jgi:hypothetical protein
MKFWRDDFSGSLFKDDRAKFRASMTMQILFS